MSRFAGVQPSYSSMEQVPDLEMEHGKAVASPPPTGHSTPLDDIPIQSSTYSAPGQDNTRGLYHSWYQQAERRTEDDSGGPGLKGAVAEFEGSWYVAAALVMTVGFALLMMQPGECVVSSATACSVGDTIASYAFLLLALLATMNSVLAVWWAGHQVPQVHWHPAADFSKFWYAALNTSMGRSQQFTKVSIEQLVLSLIPMCYLNWGWPGLILSTVAVAYFALQLKTWAFLMQRMRNAYEQGVDHGRPILDDTSSLPMSCCGNAHTEGLIGMLTCQLISSTCFSFRWVPKQTQAWASAQSVV